MSVRTGTADVLDDAELVRHTAPAEESGLGALGTERGNLPLESIDVRSTVTGLAVRTELAQGFRNTFDEPLEATYIFPLPDRAAVTALRMEADDRIVEGILKERGEARADYDQAIAEGKRASIAEEERPGVFTLRVGNIMPGERVVIRTTLAGRLPFEDGEATYRFPLVVAPRYIPGAALPGGAVGSGVAADTDAVPDASRISPPVLLPGFPNPVRLGIRVDVDAAGLGLNGLRSSLHGVDVAVPEDAKADGRDRVVVTLAWPNERADRDFILRLRLGAEDAVATALAVRPDAAADGADVEEGTFILTVLPPAAAERQRPEGRDVVLVLDRSGSMEGWKMVAARRAAARVVDTLTGRDRFAALAFDTVVETPPTLPAGLVAASDRHRFRAVEHLAKMEARGGTELAEPLAQAAALLARGDGDRRDKVLVLVTDGQVGNEDQILADLTPRLGGVRVHTIGIDRAVNEAFLRRLAQHSGGRYELVESEDRLDEAMAAIHRRIGSPVLTGITLAAAGLEIDAATLEPARMPDLFAGAPLVVSGRYRGKHDGAVTVRGELASGAANASDAAEATESARPTSPWTTTVQASQSADPTLAAYWARGRVRDLEDRYLVAYSDRDALERAIVETSLRFSVLCRFTAFVAVDSRVVNRTGGQRQVTNPVDAPDGWGMFEEEKASGFEAAVFGAGPAAVASTDLTEARREMSPGFAPAQPAAMPAPPPSMPAPAPSLTRFSAPRSPGAMPPGAVGGGRPDRMGFGAAPDAAKKSARRSRSISADLAEGLGRGDIGGGGADAAAIAARLLAGLRADESAPAEDRVTDLTDLAAVGLPALLQQLATEGAAIEDIQAVAELIRTLGGAEPDAAELERRWALAVAVLERLAGAGVQPVPPLVPEPGAAPEPRASRPFWKR